MNRLEDLTNAKRLAEKGKLDAAYSLAAHWLMENPNDLQAMVVTTFVLRKARKLPEAYHISKKVTELEPAEATGWPRDSFEGSVARGTAAPVRLHRVRGERR